jgi:hypothetical protein
MTIGKVRWFILLPVILGLVMLLPGGFEPIIAWAQQPTGSIPTVTGTPSGPIITVTSEEGFARVRSGPNTYSYPEIGILLTGDTAPALGRSPAGEWIMIAYPGVPGGVGWVYAPLVSITPGFVPIIEPPPTPTPQTTPTIDPTIAAAFIIPATATRLPTFTPPSPLVIPTYVAQGPVTREGGVPMGLIIVGLGLVGVFGALVSFLRGR